MYMLVVGGLVALSLSAAERLDTLFGATPAGVVIGVAALFLPCVFSVTAELHLAMFRALRMIEGTRTVSSKPDSEQSATYLIFPEGFGPPTLRATFIAPVSRAVVIVAGAEWSRNAATVQSDAAASIGRETRAVWSRIGGLFLIGAILAAIGISGVAHQRFVAIIVAIAGSTFMRRALRGGAARRVDDERGWALRIGPGLWRLS